MQIPTEITFHGLDRSEAVEAVVQRWVERCQQVDGRIETCEIVFQQPHRHHLRGRPFQVSLRLAVPGKDVAACCSHSDIYLAVADAFRAARRQLDARGGRRWPYDRSRRARARRQLDRRLTARS